ncbi:MAG TPA: response regulator [Bryobacteraceae bacterium]|nr:response regulator [Bryobacteraceae bacterium]
MPSETKPFEILLAEDNQGDAELVREALKEYQINCSLKVVSDGARAIDLINRMDADPSAASLDLLLLDIRLPRRDGQEVLKCLRSSERHANTPVIIMTGLSSNVLDETAIGDDVTWFEKPSTLDEFLHLGYIVRRILEQHIVGVDDRRTCRGAA